MKFKLQGNTEVGGMLGIVMIKKKFFSDNPLQKTLKNLRNLKIWDIWKIKKIKQN